MKIIPNLLTFVRVLLVPIFVYYSTRNRFVLAFLIFVIAAISDFFDGYLARKLGVVSKFGATLDPVADKILINSAYCTLTVLNFIPIEVTIVIMLRDILIVLTILLCMIRKIQVQMCPSWASKINTTVQLVYVGMVLIFLIYHVKVQCLLDILAMVVVGSTLYSGVEYARQYSWVIQKLFKW